MKREHRVSVWSLVLVVVLSLLPGGISLVAQAPQPVIHLRPSDQRIDVGQEISVEVWVNDIEGFYGAQFSLAFDQTVLEGLSIEPGAAFTDLADEHDIVLRRIDNGTVQFAGTLLRVPKAGPISGDIHLATVRYRGLTDGTSPLTWGEVKLSDAGSWPIIADQENGQIVVGTPTPPELGTLLKGVEADPARNRVYVSVQSDNTIAIIDGATQALIQSVPCQGDRPNGLALSEDNSKLFVVNTGSDQVAVLDPNNGYSLLAKIDVERAPFSIAIANGVGYVTNFDSDSVTLIDVNGMYAIRTIAVGRHPSIPAATGDRAYIPIHSAYDRFALRDPDAEWAYVQQAKQRYDTGVAIVYADGHLERILEEYIGFFAAAVDETHGRVYVTKRDGTAEGLYVLDAADNSLIQFVSMLRPYAVAVNSVTNHVFVVQADMDEIYVLDAGNGYRVIRVVDTDPNNNDIPDQHGGQGIDVLDNDVYSSNFFAGTLTIVDDSSTSGDLSVPIDVEYVRGWMESGGNESPLGVPVAPGYEYLYSEQHYERGIMHWRQVMTGTNQIYVFDIESPLSGGTDWSGREDGVWAKYDDRWDPSMPLFPAGCPDAGWPYGPMFGFGVTWCDEPGVKPTIGYPIGDSLVDYGGDQVFQNGVVLWSPATDAYMVLRSDNNRWQYYRAHRRYPIDVSEPNVVGQAQLQGRTDHRGVVLSIDGGPHLATDADGRFGFRAQGQVQVGLSHRGYLDVDATMKALPDAVNDVGQVPLIAGDVNGDDLIDILDLAYLGYRFGSSDASADLTGDGAVDILDLSLMGANYGQRGPILWPR